ncbi:MAG: alpha-glucan family phosphorylase [Methylotenera sp.]|nr:alpha-glucan family phosphorylase [Methylotenera sp.]MDO9232437.1 alpha-glucan family phosphorylase [Methylotenera sp.]MDO9389963.1 alpha-glucan family phosphorylase [Methylotenera sp.]MDP2101763.1 alpha-glucan family phosphorylase [Methylotenera sp.]MDP2281395.1 alpha-glucan family phosphorylase [Methylotenera sp.]
MLHEFTRSPRIAYFSMEIALASDIPTYAGGLGVLAGDTLRSAADLALHMVGVTLVSRAGYFDQKIDSIGRQIEAPQTWEPSDHAKPVCAKVSVQIERRTVWIGAWLYPIKGLGGAEVPVIMLDTDLPENNVEDREITHFLYGHDAAYRLKQEIVLGVGGIRMLQALGFEITKHHMNEGHSALLGMELLHRHSYHQRDLRPGEALYDLPVVRSKCIFTTHTPVEAGQDKFDYAMVNRIADGEFMDLREVRKLAGDDTLNMTRLALNLSDYVNGVAKCHAEVSQRMFPGYHVHAITNGVHPHTWTSEFFATLYDNHMPGWRHEPEQLVRIDQVADNAIWDAHKNAKQQLLDRVKETTGKTLDPTLPTFGFARRMTAYKRPDLIFTDLERLRSIAKKQPFQLVMAGKAHPYDTNGKQLIKILHDHLRELSDDISVVYMPGYNMNLALELVSGVDVWLNTPLRPLEASGTSGMKAAFNGVPSLSVLDGWWLEGCIEGVTGWAVGNSIVGNESNDVQDFYSKLENIVLPLYYTDRAGWIALMKGSIGRNASVFNTHRMIRRYATEAYML